MEMLTYVHMTFCVDESKGHGTAWMNFLSEQKTCGSMSITFVVRETGLVLVGLMIGRQMKYEWILKFLKLPRV